MASQAAHVLVLTPGLGQWTLTAAGPASLAARRPRWPAGLSLPLSPVEPSPPQAPGKEDEGDGPGDRQPEKQQQQRSGEGVSPFPLSRQDKMAAAAERG